jgi:uncharacterized protein YggE
MVDKSEQQIAVSSRARGELHATRALIEVAIEGKSRHRGDSAEMAARELEMLREAASAAGVNAEDVELIDVQMTNDQGLLLKSSSARYELRITCRDLARIGELLGRLADLDDLEMRALDWRFDEEAAVVDDLLEQAGREALARAQRLAAAVGESLAGLQSLDYSVQRGDLQPMARLRSVPMAAAGSAPAPSFNALGGPRRESIEVTVQARFRLRDQA